MRHKEVVKIAENVLISKEAIRNAMVAIQPLHPLARYLLTLIRSIHL